VPGVNLAGLACSLLGVGLAFVGAILAIVRQRYGLMIAPLAGGLLNLLALLVITIILATAGVMGNTDGPGKPAEGWGEAFDPNGDCTIQPAPGRLVIKVPARAHDLSAELGRVNAPRVLQNVSGDFTAQVKVSGTFQPAPPSTIPDRLPYNGAGLLLWQDGNNYLRLERAALNRDGQVQSYAALELRAGGQVVNPQAPPLVDGDTYLRLERRGNMITGSVSQDGRQWSPFLPVAVNFPQQARVGVTAINSSAEPFTVQFEQLQILRAGGQ
jgi:adhesin HecA-like repeat protein